MNVSSSIQVADNQVSWSRKPKLENALLCPGIMGGVSYGTKSNTGHHSSWNCRDRQVDRMCLESSHSTVKGHKQMLIKLSYIFLSVSSQVEENHCLPLCIFSCAFFWFPSSASLTCISSAEISENCKTALTNDRGECPITGLNTVQN